MLVDRDLSPGSTGITGVLRAIRNDVESGVNVWDCAPIAAQAEDFRICVAIEREQRERAYRLAQQVYSERGYLDSKPMSVSRFDADPQTMTLLVQDAAGRDAATVSLVFDSPEGLPCDEIYRDELDTLRAQDRKLVEVTRLAIAEPFRRSTALLVRLFNFIYVFARRVKGFDDFVIEVNPRHCAYYSRLLLFEQIGGERPCPRVRGAPAVLMRLNLVNPEREVRRVGGRGASAKERTLYPYFYSWLEEGAVAEFLARRSQPMSDADARYFGLGIAS